MRDLSQLTKEQRKEYKQTRYYCFRIQNKINGGAAVGKLPVGFKKKFQDNPFFNILNP